MEKDMNKARRKELQKAMDLLDEASSIIEACRDEEQEAYDNLPDGIQESEKGEVMGEYIYQMDEAIDIAESISNILAEITGA